MLIFIAAATLEDYAIAGEIQKLEPSAIVELFELDLTPFGGDLLLFHAGTNELLANITWDGSVYTAFPVAASGFEFNGQGQAPRPKMMVSNVAGSITALVLQYEDLVGAKVTRRRTLAKYLDEVNFAGGNPTADPSAEFPHDIFYIDRKSVETNEIVEFELAPAMDVTGVMLPRRQIIQNICPWKYRGSECGWTTPNPRVNKLLQSNGFTVSPWVAQNGILITANFAADPFGGSTANRVVFPSGVLARFYQDCTTVAGGVATLTVYAKSNTGSNQLLDIYLRQTGFGTVYAFTNFTATTAWQRFTITATIPAGVSVMALFYQTNTAVTNDLLMYGAQLEIGSGATTYQSIGASYTDPTYFDTNDASVGSLALDACGKRLTSCKTRFGQYAEIPYGGFPVAGLFR